ncbi:MAG: FAD-dependent oxidoreductase, partial [Desulfobacterales bacterium]|nr:FAD-dependent oxidoreductase [Desulfobacterales bacterium]
MGKHLVIVGAGHAHLTILKNLNTFKNMGHDVTVISATPYHYYSGMGPGLMSGIYRPQDVRFHVKKMVEDRGGRFIVDKVININPEKKRLYLNNGDTIKYDVVSFNTGSFIPVESLFQPDESVFILKPIENLLDARDKIIKQLKTKTLKITVAGGGPAGVEISGNLRRLIE